MTVAVILSKYVIYKHFLKSSLISHLAPWRRLKTHDHIEALIPTTQGPGTLVSPSAPPTELSLCNTFSGTETPRGF